MIYLKHINEYGDKKSDFSFSRKFEYYIRSIRNLFCGMIKKVINTFHVELLNKLAGEISKPFNRKFSGSKKCAEESCTIRTDVFNGCFQSKPHSRVYGGLFSKERKFSISIGDQVLGFAEGERRFRESWPKWKISESVMK